MAEDDIDPWVKEVLRVRAVTGMSLAKIYKGMKQADATDPMFGACYTHASGLAANVIGGPEVRHEWNMAHARGMMERMSKFAPANDTPEVVAEVFSEREA